MNVISPEQRRHQWRCLVCNKWAYGSRKKARHVLRTAHVGDRHVQIYRCPADRSLWHLGHSSWPAEVTT